MGKRLIKTTCAYCHKEFKKPVTEYNRNKKLGRPNYCSRNCSGKANSKNLTSTYDISQHAGNSRDEYSDFRYYYRNCHRRDKECTITLQDLKDQWKKQQGICPYTGTKLQLKTWSNKPEYTKQASIDRIDNSKGYIPGNIEFIALPINYLKADKLSKEETLNFIKQISTS